MNIGEIHQKDESVPSLQQIRQNHLLAKWVEGVLPISTSSQKKIESSDAESPSAQFLLPLGIFPAKPISQHDLMGPQEQF